MSSSKIFESLIKRSPLNGKEKKEVHLIVYAVFLLRFFLLLRCKLFIGQRLMSMTHKLDLGPVQQVRHENTEPKE